ncbi:hypothetical protein FHS27_003176 [Rhodopirellula rubra]|uniref:Uncharacterized protein n=1 Tax=Aporhodopirellula rubra TaxID=980271 RepID=A0A7W5H6V4_9BACT|nr:hypothetical protein [Aporhodopirellula rubra]
MSAVESYYVDRPYGVMSLGRFAKSISHGRMIATDLAPKASHLASSTMQSVFGVDAVVDEGLVPNASDCPTG